MNRSIDTYHRVTSAPKVLYCDREPSRSSDAEMLFWAIFFTTLVFFGGGSIYYMANRHIQENKKWELVSCAYQQHSQGWGHVGVYTKDDSQITKYFGADACPGRF